MPNYIPYDLSQNTMVVINLRDQLQPETFEHTLAELVDNHLDLSLFAKRINNDETGRPAYDPAIMLKIILFAYSKGITSSRDINWCCRHNIIFKALSCDSEPSFVSIANFVSSHAEAIEDLFEQILLICSQAGLIGNELFATDGCKIPSNAAKEWSGTFNELEAKRKKYRTLISAHIKEHQHLDKNEPKEAERAKRLEQSISTIEKAYQKVDAFLKNNEPRMGKGKVVKEVKSNITDNESAKIKTSKGTIQGYNGVATVDKKHQVIVDAQAFGEGAEHHTLRPVIETIQARYQRLGLSEDVFKSQTIFTADTGFANEANMKFLNENNINAYVPDNQFRSRDPKFAKQKAKYGKRHQDEVVRKKKVIDASEFDYDPLTRTCMCPSGKAMRYEGERKDGKGDVFVRFEGRLSSCEACELSERCMVNPASAKHRKGHGRVVSFKVKPKVSYTDWMKGRIDSPLGKQIYSHRMSVVEPVFANITSSKKLDRFSLRGRKKVNAQWQLFCTIHNIEKLKNYGELVN